MISLCHCLLVDCQAYPGDRASLSMEIAQSLVLVASSIHMNTHMCLHISMQPNRDPFRSPRKHRSELTGATIVGLIDRGAKAS